ncbi:MAG: WD40 repeat domain-containing protein [Polyangiaceae bacterium]|nr:WD40 repeat domain-containing protein [Polyangiaceae bacterium]
MVRAFGLCALLAASCQTPPVETPAPPRPEPTQSATTAPTSLPTAIPSLFTSQAGLCPKEVDHNRRRDSIIETTWPAASMGASKGPPVWMLRQVPDQRGKTQLHLFLRSNPLVQTQWVAEDNYAVAFQPQGKVLVYVTHAMHLMAIDLPTLTIRHSAESSTGTESLFSAVFSSDGQRLLINTDAGPHVIDPATLRRVGPAYPPDEIEAGDTSPGMNRYAFSTTKGAVYWVDITASNPKSLLVTRIKGGLSVVQLAWLGEKDVSILTSDGGVAVWSVEKKSTVKRLVLPPKNNENAVVSIAASPLGVGLTTVRENGEISLFERSTWTERVLPGAADDAPSVAWAPSKDRFFAIASDRILTWDVHGKQLADLPMPSFEPPEPPAVGIGIGWDETSELVAITQHREHSVRLADGATLTLITVEWEGTLREFAALSKGIFSGPPELAACYFPKQTVVRFEPNLKTDFFAGKTLE